MKILSSLNLPCDPDVHAMYMGNPTTGIDWLNLIVPNRNEQKASQCIFCQMLFPTPKEAADHIIEVHAEMMFVRVSLKIFFLKYACLTPSVCANHIKNTLGKRSLQSVNI